MHDDKCSIVLIITFIPPTLIPNFSLSHIYRNLKHCRLEVPSCLLLKMDFVFYHWSCLVSIESKSVPFLGREGREGGGVSSSTSTSKYHAEMPTLNTSNQP